jgi:lipoprotein-anchoring transpeptidase ErfK/SrfK
VTGTVLVDTAACYVFYVLPDGKVVRYGATVGEGALAWSGIATVGRTWNGQDGPRPRMRSGDWAPFRTTAKAVHAIRSMRALYLLQAARTRCFASTARTRPN